MPPQTRTRQAAIVELTAVLAGFALLTMAATFPLAFRLSTYGYRLDTVGDHQYSVWNVAWVAHGLLTDPLHVLDANIFYPHKWTLIYSEANLLTGALGIPVYALTRDAFATHNFVVLLSFVLSGSATYYLARYLTGDRRAAVLAGICFAFCPFVFGHLPHIQLLMTAGMPLSLLAFHRMTDQPTAGRGVALGLAMGAQALACAYYAIFIALLIGFAVLLTPALRRGWSNRAYWTSTLVAALVAIVIVLPLFVPYLLLQRESGFERTLGESVVFSARWSEYVTSNAYAARWLLPSEQQRDLLFPGFVALLLGVAGFFRGWTGDRRSRETAILYGGAAVIALWISFGPAGRLYSALYYALPAMSFIRVPSRFGIVVTLSLSVLAALAASGWLKRSTNGILVFGALLAVTVADHTVPDVYKRIGPNPEIAPVYRFLATQPYGALIEMPPLSRTLAFTRTKYMLGSTVHWMPLVNAYSDHVPEAFDDRLAELAGFPSISSVKSLQRDRVRYAIFHMDEYRKNLGALPELEAKLDEFAPDLRLLYKDPTDRTRLYELLSAP